MIIREIGKILWKIFVYFGVVCLALSAIYWYDNAETNCTNVLTPYKTVTIKDDSITYDNSYIKTHGVKGQDRLCKAMSGRYVSVKTISQPIDAIYVEGTFVQPYIPTPAPQYQSYGSICNDGTWSPSTGRGTCSWHGGVAY